MTKYTHNQAQLRAAIDHARLQVNNGEVAPLNAEDIIKKARTLYADIIPKHS